MANNTKATEQAAKPVSKAVPADSVYSAAELAANNRLFGTGREVVVVALRQAGVDSATFEEAKAILEKFKNTEVK